MSECSQIIFPLILSSFFTVIVQYSYFIVHVFFIIIREGIFKEKMQGNKGDKLLS